MMTYDGGKEPLSAKVRAALDKAAREPWQIEMDRQEVMNRKARYFNATSRFFSSAAAALEADPDADLVPIAYEWADSLTPLEREAVFAQHVEEMARGDKFDLLVRSAR